MILFFVFFFFHCWSIKYSNPSKDDDNYVPENLQFKKNKSCIELSYNIRSPYWIPITVKDLEKCPLTRYEDINSSIIEIISLLQLNVTLISLIEKLEEIAFNAKNLSKDEKNNIEDLIRRWNNLVLVRAQDKKEAAAKAQDKKEAAAKGKRLTYVSFLMENNQHFFYDKSDITEHEEETYPDKSSSNELESVRAKLRDREIWRKWFLHSKKLDYDSLKVSNLEPIIDDYELPQVSNLETMTDYESSQVLDLEKTMTHYVDDDSQGDFNSDFKGVFQDGFNSDFKFTKYDEEEQAENDSPPSNDGFDS